LFQFDWLEGLASWPTTNLLPYLGELLSAFQPSAFFLHSFTPLVQTNSWLLQPLEDQERGFLSRSPFWVWHYAGPSMSLGPLISKSKSLVALQAQGS
jgi:hypothetical protein